MFENIMNFFRKLNKKENKIVINSKEAAKERLHLVLMQDRANVSADFLELMKQEIIEVIKKYIDVDESSIDVRLTNKENGDGTNGAPALYANIPILNIKNETRKVESKEKENNKKSEKIKNKEKVVVKAEKEEKNKIEKNKIKEEKKEKIEQDKSKESKTKINEDTENKQTNDKKIEEKDENNEAKDKIKSEK